MASKDRHNCSIERGPLCINKKSIKDMSDNFKKAYKEYVEMMHQDIVHIKNDCLKKIYEPNYWKLKVEEEEKKGSKTGIYIFLISAAGAIIVIVVLILIIYLKKSKSTSDEGLTQEDDET